MYKMLVAVMFVTSLLLCGCNDSKELAPVKPTDLISEKEAETAMGGADLVLEHDAVVNLGNNEFVASYYGEPLGSADPVIVSVIYPSAELSEPQIKEMYTDSYSARDNKKKIRGLGAGAFVAFPTINIYEDGHLIKITAGSGDTKEQLDLLISLGQIAVDNLHTYLHSGK